MESDKTACVSEKDADSSCDASGFLTLAVNRCRLHVTTVKSRAPERAQTMTEIFHKTNMNIEQKKNSTPTLSARSRLQTWSRSRAASEDRADLSEQSAALLAGAGLDPHAGNTARRKSRRPACSEGATCCQLVVKNHKQSGSNHDTVAGFSFTQLPAVTSCHQLDLERRFLKKFPQLDDMNEVQFLNLQCNLITRIQHLSHLQHLFFLNLCDNYISDMSGIEVLRSLRVLLLGRNRIKKICCLENLSRLNVLDLHDNQICRIEKISHLNELQVLNLSGNCISRLENLQGLNSLTELNLRRNCISAVVRNLYPLERTTSL